MSRASFRFKVALRLALREMRGGLKGFYIFLACIALGVGAIAAVNSLSRTMTDAIASEGRNILAGDVRFELNNREATPAEADWLAGLGTVSVSTGLRSMVRLPDGADQTLAEVRGVDGLYPLYGTLETDPKQSSADLFAEKDGAFGAIAAPLLVERLGLKPGAELLLGKAKLRLTAALVNEPDALSEGFGFAPRVMVSRAALQASGLIQTGSLVEHAYRIKLTAPIGDEEAIRGLATKAFPDAGWSVRTSERASPSLTDNIARFTQFLTLVGLTALIVGGVGVANAVRAFLDSKRSTIAAFKCLGAPGFVVTLIYFFQILLIASIGIAIGLVIGAVTPLAAAGFLRDVLPVSATPSVYPSALGLAALFGYLTTVAFAILPLGHAREVPATALFREQGFEKPRLPSWPYLAGAAVTLAALAALAVLSAHDWRIAVVFLVAIGAAFIVLRLVAVAISALARKSPRVRSPALRLAIGNIYRPGALTASVVLSLGLGLALLVTLALIDGNLRRELGSTLPERAPNFFFVDIQSAERDGFRAIIHQQAPNGELTEVPMLRGRILAFNGEAVNASNVPPSARWVLRGDRGVTYSETVPKNSKVSAGEWWPKDYAGEPLVSFSAKEAGEIGLKVGDKVTVNVLGRSITAKIANFRTVDWESLSINFVMVFSPNTFKGAPHTWLATLSDPGASPQQEGAVLRSVTNAYPTITSVRVKDALDTANRLVGQITTAIRAAAAIALVASVLVLAGALAAGNRARAHDAVILKTLGGTRRLLIRAFTYEYLILGFATAVFSLLSGGVAAWYVVSRIMNLRSLFLTDVAVTTVVVALVMTVGIGLAGTWRILGQKAAPMLREL